MTRPIPVNLQPFYRCRKLPGVEWRLEGELLIWKRSLGQHVLDRLRKEPEFYDPWEKRDEFFTLKPDNPQALLEFLNSTGLFGHGLAFRGEWISSKWGSSSKWGWVETPVDLVWNFRKLLERCLTEKADAEMSADFKVEFETVKRQGRVVFVTDTLVDALRLTIVTDRVQGAKVRKCARPDCGIPFTQTTGYDKKFHCWECGHVMSERRRRKEAAKIKKGRNR
jgi:hypothetical protein